jgi:hypothetical protein
MPDVSLEMIQEMLRRVLDDLRDIRAVLREHTEMLGRIEVSLGRVTLGQAEQWVRIDRLAERVERIERRLDLRDA